MSQCADAIQVLLERKCEGLMTARQLARLADRLAQDLAVTQARNRRARAAHCRRRARELHQLGIQYGTLPCCDD